LLGRRERVSPHHYQARSVRQAATLEEAWEFVERWLEHENVRIVQETGDHARLRSELLRQAGTGGDLTTDAWIAAIALSHGASVLSLDSDFARFPGLRWETPMQ
jgi:uncharacterized protein